MAHVQGPEVNGPAGADIPVGNVIVDTTGPLVGPVPMFETVIGTSLGDPATNGVTGWPILVVTSGVPTTVGVLVGPDGLFAVTVSPVTGVVVAEKVNGEPNELGVGVIGT